MVPCTVLDVCETRCPRLLAEPRSLLAFAAGERSEKGGTVKVVLSWLRPLSTRTDCLLATATTSGVVSGVRGGWHQKMGQQCDTWAGMDVWVFFHHLTYALQTRPNLPLPSVVLGCERLSASQAVRRVRTSWWSTGDLVHDSQSHDRHNRSADTLPPMQRYLMCLLTDGVVATLP